MATKHFCDRCGEETMGGLYRLAVSTRVHSVGDSLEDGDETKLDLCVQCAQTILADANTPLKGRR